MLVEIAPMLPQNGALEAERITSMPILVLNLHSRCNCRCMMCDIWKRSESNELSASVLARHRESLRALKVRWVVLSGGEPLMNSGFERICEFLRSEGIRITLLTAGLSLQKRAEDVACNVNDVIVSLDGPRDVHDRIRGIHGAYDLLQQGILNLLSRRPEMRITGRTTVQRANHNALRATVAAAQELDLSGISFLAADLTSAAFNRPEAWPQEHEDRVALTDDEVTALDTEIDAMIASFPREIRTGYIAESPAKLRRIAQHFRAHLGLATPVAPMCNAPWVSAVIGHDGSVQPCFFHAPIGNIQQESLADVVNGPAALAFRHSLNVPGNPTCQRCVCSLHLESNPIQ